MTKNSTATTYVLPKDVIITPASDYDEKVLSQIGADANEYFITRPKSRENSRVIDKDFVTLLEHFREPSTVPEAIIAYSKAAKADPQNLLEDAYESIRALVRSRLLLPNSSPLAKEIKAEFEIGDHFQDYEIVKVVQLLEDTEIYKAKNKSGKLVGLKIAKEGRGIIKHLYKREAEILNYLGKNNYTTSLIEFTQEKENTYLITEWCEGELASETAAKLRSTHTIHSLLQICRSILESYQFLISKGVFHGDIHPGNIIIKADGTARLLDFGFARTNKGKLEFHPIGRAGVYNYYEPEFAEAHHKQTQRPLTNEKGEQYSVAALLYYLISGSHYFDFPIEKEKLYQSILEEAPVSFTQRNIYHLEAVEKVLFKALSKKAEDRYKSMKDFLNAFSVAVLPPNANETKENQLQSIFDQFITDYAVDGEYYQTQIPTTPLCSVNNGYAGVAMAFYRMAVLSNSAAMLSTAEAWAIKAEQALELPNAFYEEGGEITEESVGKISPYHSPSGVFAVRCLIAKSKGDDYQISQSLNNYFKSTVHDCKSYDLTLGYAGVLLCDSILMDALSTETSDFDPTPQLKKHGDYFFDLLVDYLSSIPSLYEQEKETYTGIAHGWSGFLYVLLNWSVVSGKALPAWFRERLVELDEIAVSVGEGKRWSRQTTFEKGKYYRDSVAGWCNGSGGNAFLFSLAYKVLKEERWLETAKAAAYDAWNDHSNFHDLCCGLAGRAYAQLNLYRLTKDDSWLKKARQLAKRLNDFSEPEERAGLYKGVAGMAVLASDLQHPEYSAMPLFELEGWNH